ncbi:MAG TPA: glycosyltransferase [Flavobacteriales bacterium]|nr:glycosyltransferase [Flavobacteriales bacterium]
MLERALNSVLSQTSAVQEIIVVDDGSTDSTRELLSTYVETYDNVHYLKLDTNGGAQKARNIGLKHAKGDWIAFLDSDNVYYPDMIEKLSSHLKSNTELDVVTCYSTVKDDKDNRKRAFGWETRGDIRRDILCEKMYVDYSSAIIRRSKLLEIGLLDEKCPSYQEWDTFIALSRSSRFDFVPEELTIYYEHGGKRISSSPLTNFEGRFYLLRKYKKDIRLNCSEHEYDRLLDVAFNKTGEICSYFDRFKCRMRFMIFTPQYVVRRMVKSLKRKTKLAQTKT